MTKPYIPKGTSVSAPTEAEQLQEFKQASQKTRGAFDLRPVLTKNEFVYRIFVVEKPAIDRLIAQGHRVREILYYWSDLSAEAHALPIFETDSIEDVVNRYSDFFPIELAEFQKSLAEYNKALNNMTGKTDGGDMVIKVKCPVGLYRALLSLDPNFWHIKRNIYRFKRQFSRLVSVGRPKGTQA